MNCADYVDRIARRLDGTLSPVEMQEIEDHIAYCARCRAESLLQARIARALAEPEETGLAADFAERVSRHAFAGARRGQRSRRWGYLMPVAVNAALLLLVIVYRANVANALKPGLSALGNLGAAAAGWLVKALHAAGGSAAPVETSVPYIVGILGPLACAAVIVIVASSRIYALSRR